MSKLLEQKRATRGLRMAELVGQAADDDQQFWNDDIWKEDEDDSDAESYDEEEEEAKPDEFDSDFNDSETEDEEESDDEAKVQKASKASAMVCYKLLQINTIVARFTFLLSCYFFRKRVSQSLMRITIHQLLGVVYLSNNGKYVIYQKVPHLQPLPLSDRGYNRVRLYRCSS
jgi:hypothetical protein